MCGLYLVSHVSHNNLEKMIAHESGRDGDSTSSGNLETIFINPALADQSVELLAFYVEVAGGRTPVPLVSKLLAKFAMAAVGRGKGLDQSENLLTFPTFDIVLS